MARHVAMFGCVAVYCVSQGLVAMILVRALYRDFSRYNRVGHGFFAWCRWAGCSCLGEERVSRGVSGACN